MPKFLNKKTLYAVLPFIIAVAVIFFLVGSINLDNRPYSAPTATATLSTFIQNTTSTVPISNSTTTTTKEVAKSEDGRLLAKSIVVYDISSSTVLYSLNPDTVLPIASITKLMTAYTASELTPLSSIITISQNNASTADSSGLVSNEMWMLKDLIAFMLVSSSNGGAEAIADNLTQATSENFVDEMNASAQNLGLNNTFFRNPTGLDINNGQTSGSHSTASDIASMYSYILKNKPEILDKTNQNNLVTYSLNGTRYNVDNTNWLIYKIPNLISSKTGTTNLAGGNLAFIFEPEIGHKVVMVILGSTPNGRFSDAEKLINFTVGHFNKNNI